MSCPHLRAGARFIRPMAPLVLAEVRFVTCLDCAVVLEGWGTPAETYAIADLSEASAVLPWQAANANGRVEPGPSPASSPRRARSQAAQDHAQALFAHAAEIDDLRPTEAIALYEQTLTLNPAHADAMVNLGNLHLRDGVTTLAVTLYRSALDVDPDHIYANYNLGHTCLDLDDLALAIEYLQRAVAAGVAAGTPMADAHYNLAQAYARRGAFDFARSHLKRFVDLEPFGAWAKAARRYLADEDALRRAFAG